MFDIRFDIGIWFLSRPSSAKCVLADEARDQGAKMLSDLQNDCMTKATEFDTEQKSRDGELEALATAKSILEEKTGAAADRSYSFLQLHSGSKTRAGLKASAQAAHFLCPDSLQNSVFNLSFGVVARRRCVADLRPRPRQPSRSWSSFRSWPRRSRCERCRRRALEVNRIAARCLRGFASVKFVVTRRRVVRSPRFAQSWRRAKKLWQLRSSKAGQSGHHEQNVRNLER